MQNTLASRLTQMWAVWSQLEKIGEMVGLQRTTASGPNYYLAFEWILYAKPPHSEDSFRNPVSDNYMHNREYKVYFKDVDPKNCKVFGEEDCLRLNVYTPVSYDYKKMPVLIWIDGNLEPLGEINYEPKRLMDEWMVFMSMSYRVGPLGFSSKPNIFHRGNFGLKDQEMSINWVITNIHKFGGDPKRINLGGEGLGAAFALHHLNNAMKGKIKSGIALVRTMGFRAEVMGGERIKADDLVLESYKMRTEQLNHSKLLNDGILMQRTMLLPFLPVVDGKTIKYNPWVRPGEATFNLLLGLKKDEVVNRYNWTDAIVKSIFKSRVDYEVMTGKPFDRKDSTVRQELTDLYDEEDSSESKNLRNLAGDGWFVFPAMAEAEYHVGPLTAFMYDNFNPTGYPPCLMQSNVPSLTFDCPLHFRYEEVASKMTRLISNFVHQRDFSFELKPYSKDKEVFNTTQALLDPAEFKTIDTRMSKRMEKWKSLNMLSLHSQ